MLKDWMPFAALCLMGYGAFVYVKSDTERRAVQQASLPPQERLVPNSLMLSSCQSFVQARVPGPVDFKYFLSDTVEKPGETTWHTVFTSAERSYRLTCTVLWNGKVTGTITAG